MRAVNAASRAAHLGEGTVAGGRLALRMAPGLASHLASRRAVTLVSGTNGKTTTTACLAAALSTAGPVATNATGANMLPGHVAALGAARSASFAALECDEVWLPNAMVALSPGAVVLLNLSRDQLDRTSEVRHVARAWRGALAAFDGWCVANADDPLVVYAASAAPRAAWFAGGLAFRSDAIACPACVRQLVYDDAGWRCACGRQRPEPDAELTDDGATVDGLRVAMHLELPGSFNARNALGALLCAVRLGVEPAEAALAIGTVTEVAGRFGAVAIEGVEARLMLAKNPAGWAALLDLVEGEATPLVIAINARLADGRDPSWLYDVAFERLAGRDVVAAGERVEDLSARLYYAGVEHRCVPDARAAISDAARANSRVDVIANYTAFSALNGGR